MKARKIAGLLAGVAASAGVVLATSGTAATSAPTAEANITAYTNLTAQVYGTPDEQLKGKVWLHTKLQNTMRDCMAGKGGYQPQAYIGLSSGVTAPGDLDVAAPLGNDFGIAVSLERHFRGVEANLVAGGNQPGIEAAKDPQKNAAYSLAWTACAEGKDPKGITDPGIYDAYYPAGVRALSVQLTEVLSAAQANETVKPLLANYRTCMAAAGLKTNSWLELVQSVAKQFPKKNQAWSAVSASPGWAAAVQLEQDAARADATCRRPAHVAALALAAPGLAKIGADPALATIRNDWSAISTSYVNAGLN